MPVPMANELERTTIQLFSDAISKFGFPIVYVLILTCLLTWIVHSTIVTQQTNTNTLTQQTVLMTQMHEDHIAIINNQKAIIATEQTLAGDDDAIVRLIDEMNKEQDLRLQIIMGLKKK